MLAHLFSGDPDDLSGVGGHGPAQAPAVGRAFFSRASRRIVSIASWGTEALCTRAPAFSASRLKRSISSGSRPMFFSRIARALCLPSSQGISRLAWRYLALCWLEARLRAVWRLTSLRAFLARRRVF